jgi:hypothetical protein
MVSLRTRCWAPGSRSAWLRPGRACVASGLSGDPDAAPLIRYLTVVHGARRMSSWSTPRRLAPLTLSTPITVNGTFLTRISSPTGLRPRNSSRTRVRPITQTLLPLRISRSLKTRPRSRSVQLRATRKSSVLPVR